MKTLALIEEVIATYQRHGWNLKRVLLGPATRAEVNYQAGELLKEARFVDAEFDALWFARPSHQGREAWELRLFAQLPYALFEAFEPDEPEEERGETRREHETRIKGHGEQSLQTIID